VSGNLPSSVVPKDNIINMAAFEGCNSTKPILNQRCLPSLILFGITYPTLPKALFKTIRYQFNQNKDGTS
jgi:hypothetical protein